jgi:hypothetical protein
MKTIYPLLTLLSTSLVSAAPAPFVGTGPVVAAGTENVVIPTTNFDRREAAIVQDFGKSALQLRGALLAARGGQGNANANNDAAGGDQADGAAQAAQAKGKGKNADAQAAADQQAAQDAAAGKLN